MVKAAEKADRFPLVYVQVNIGEEEQKGGCPIGEVGALIDAGSRVAAAACRADGDPPGGSGARALFALLAELARRHGVTGLSMGMSADYETAVMLGATAVRVGTALFED